MAGRPIIALLSLILLAGGIVLEFFIVLSGGIRGTPINHTYFLSIANNNLPVNTALGGSRTAWTYYGLAGLNGANSATTAYGAKHAAFPFDPQRNFGLSQQDATSDLPAGFINTNYYYYLSRFAWVFYIIALFFAVIALFTGLLALCSRIGGYLSGLNAAIATFFMALAASLMTAWTVKGRNSFNSFDNAYNAKLGRYAYGFTWGAFAAYFLAMILFCISGAAGGRKETTYKEKKGFFGRKQSTRSRDGVKSEYS